MRYFTNLAPATRVANVGGISNVSTSMYVDSATGYPTNYPFTLRLEPNTANEELVEVTSGLGTVGTPWLITRGVDGTTAKSHIQTSTVSHGASARDLQDTQNHIARTDDPHGPAHKYVWNFNPTAQIVIDKAAGVVPVAPGAHVAATKRATTSSLLVTMNVSGFTGWAGTGIYFSVSVDGGASVRCGSMYFVSGFVRDWATFAVPVCAGFAPATYNVAANVEVNNVAGGHNYAIDQNDWLSMVVEEYQPS